MDAVRPWIITRAPSIPVRRRLCHRARATSVARPTLVLTGCGKTFRADRMAGYDHPPAGTTPCARCLTSKGRIHNHRYTALWTPLSPLEERG
jgi:hypothetical protein